MLLDRLRRMPVEELRWRATVAARTAAAAGAARLRTPRWQRSDLERALAAGVLKAGARDAIAARDWLAAHRTLAAALRDRPARFVLDPASAAVMRQTILSHWPAAVADAKERGDRILRGEHDLLGYRQLSFTRNGHAIDWHFDPVHRRGAPRVFYAQVPYLDPSIGDHKVIWEINRHQHWLRLGRAAWLTGDARYGDRIVDDLESWLAVNPPLVGINWASMLEIGFRAIAWTWAVHCLLGIEDVADAAGGRPAAVHPATPWLVDMFVALDRQLTHVEQNLSYYFSPNTHLTGEALALYVTGVALPELARSSRWTATGRRILLAEIDRQILPDGGHAERSTHYQRYTLDFYLLALLTARLAGDTEAEARFADAATRLAEFTRTIGDDTGRLPLIGDDDGGMLWPLAGRACNDVRDSLALAASIFGRPDLAPWGPAEEAVWVGGAAAATGARWEQLADAAPPSRLLGDTGYLVARSDLGDHAVFDVGAHGYLNAGHAHADALSLTLALRGDSLLMDPGTATYTIDPLLRDRMRSSASHNTITVDGRSPSAPAGPFHWQTRTDAQLEASRVNGAFDWAEASHRGYAPLTHRRSLLRTECSGWLIVDDIVGPGRHTAAAHWHFDPAWTVTLDGARLQAVHRDGARAWLLHDGGQATLHRADTETGLGWIAPAYGQRLPTSTLRVAAEGDAPFTLVTWIGHGREWQQPRLVRVPVTCDAATPAVGAQVTDGARTAVFMLRSGGPLPRAARGCRVADYETDARVLHYAAGGDRLLIVDVADASYCSTARPGWLALAAEAPIPDLHVTLADGVLDLQASIRPPALRLQVATAFHSVRLNGREWTRRETGFVATLLIHPSDWPVDAPRTSPTRPWRSSGAAFADH